jgi:hypothetical protein
MTERRGASAEREARAAEAIAANAELVGRVELMAEQRRRATEALMDARDAEVTTLADLVRRPRWHHDAACRGRGDFFDLAVPDAVAICQECRVKRSCLDAGLEERDGVWAGTTPEQRRRLRREAG